MSQPVSQSITRRSASNLALAFILLPRERRDAMAALYAFCREVDDVADEDAIPVADREAELRRWRSDIQLACLRGQASLAVNRELVPVIQRFHLPFAHFDELIRGVEMDLEVARYETFAQLEAYCYRVASVVGLLSIEIFGYRNPASRDYAVALGKALQFTNILRDVRNDAERGRVYFPAETLDRFGVRPEEILRMEWSERFRAMAGDFASRARAFYGLARSQLPPEDRRAMAAAELMGSVYWRLLRQLEGCGFQVFGSHPTRVSNPMKVLLIARTWFRLSLGVATPNYGTA